MPTFGEGPEQAEKDWLEMIEDAIEEVRASMRRYQVVDGNVMFAGRRASSTEIAELKSDIDRLVSLLTLSCDSRGFSDAQVN